MNFLAWRHREVIVSGLSPRVPPSQSWYWSHICCHARPSGSFGTCRGGQEPCTRLRKAEIRRVDHLRHWISLTGDRPSRLLKRLSSERRYDCTSATFAEPTSRPNAWRWLTKRRAVDIFL